MLRRITCLFSFFLFLSTPVLAKTFTIGGSRPATLLTPTNTSTSQKIPLVVFLHGYTSNGPQSDTFFGISKQRDALNIAVALPNGTQNSEGNRFWNATPECCDFEQTGVNDAAYIAGLIREAASVAPIDPTRVYLVGHSNGGFMSYRMACEYPELLRGIISVSGAFFRNPALCKNPGLLNILQIHGTQDPTVPLAGGGGLPSTQSGIDYWVQRGSCDDVRETPKALDLVSVSGAETDTLVWDNCQAATKVGYWKVNGTAHAPYFNANWLKEALKFVE
ncbi:MAG TPA: alpha/beta fold hydrolase [Oligoflexus sp.]|uniref:alpha/beta hydrolase family esterase n=1 Tax=Oligoflexus sp. TaxID=1971216 RepID=UPI002D6C7BDD|nr:alpha/beta fold hydrolase [Oligoflexus sp.]HYX33601.1 alpha/beta fold hydrolase [Oligoflexus sp.]